MAESETIPAANERYLAILWERADPDPAAYQAGREAHDAGIEFSKNPHKKFRSIPALSWRLGWNDRAVRRDRQGRKTDP